MTESTKPLTLDGLDDLAKDEKFTYRGKEYTIPALSQRTAEKLAELANNIRPAIDKEDIIAIMRFDAEYIACAMAAGDAKEEEKIKGELATWSRRVLSRISRFIASTMQGPVEEAIPEEKREAAKK